MLGSLTGTVRAHLNQKTLIDVQGVGYWVFTGSWQPDGELTCYLHHHVREDASDLYGFVDLPTLALFERLIDVNGIGPKAGMAILSVGNAERVAQAIAGGDAAFLTLAPGVGSKAAQKIILELKNKVEAIESGATLHSDILAALESLGYRQGDIRPFLSEIPAELNTLDQQLKWVLQQINR